MVSFKLIVFDETVGSCSQKLGKVVGLQGKGVARVCCVREQQLCVQIPFSSNDGRTLFIAIIFQKTNGDGDGKDCIKLRATRHDVG